MNNVYVKSTVWKFMEKIGNQLINFIITIILARILGATEYGTVALLSIFVTFATVIVQDGFNVALIRQKEIDEDLYKSSLYFSLLLAIILYIILYILAIPISLFFNNSLLISMLRVLGLLLFPSALNSIQVAYFTKKFQFKKMFICNFIAVLISGSISIMLALNGIKAWAIIINHLLYQILSCFLFILIGKWRLRGKFRLDKLKNIVDFGSKMLATGLIINLFLNLRSLLIGRFYTTTELGYFNRGKSFPSTVMDVFNNTVQSVVLPIYSNEQNNLEILKKYIRKTIKISSFFLFPILIGIICIAEPMINVLLGNDWRNAIIFVQIFSISYLFQPSQLATIQALKALGYGKIVLRMECVKKGFEIILLLICIQINPIVIAGTTILSGMFSFFVIIFPNRKYLGYSIKEQINDILIPFLKAFIMGSVVLVFNILWNGNSIFKLVCDVIIGGGIYCFILIISKDEVYKEIIEIIKRKGQKEYAKK